MSSSAIRRGESEEPLPPMGALAQLLHALNQPLTGLQCALEVALARQRTVEQYVERLREGLELTERMRALVEAIRELANVEEDKHTYGDSETIDLKIILRETVDELAPVAEIRGVALALECAAFSSLAVRAEPRSTRRTVFRLLESALTMAEPESSLQVETGGRPDGSWIRIRWQGGRAAMFSRPELGLLIAQAAWERHGAEWERERTGAMETVMIRLPGAGKP